MSGTQGGGGKRGPRLSAEGAAARAAREARLSEALRANLRRRKAQARGRADPEAAAKRAGGEGEDAAPGDGAPGGRGRRP